MYLGVSLEASVWKPCQKGTNQSGRIVTIPFTWTKLLLSELKEWYGVKYFTQFFLIQQRKKPMLLKANILDKLSNHCNIKTQNLAVGFTAKLENKLTSKIKQKKCD